jgi:hypothetical protein
MLKKCYNKIIFNPVFGLFIICSNQIQLKYNLINQSCNKPVSYFFVYKVHLVELKYLFLKMNFF